MTHPPSNAQEHQLDGLLTSFAQRLPKVAHALAVSVDGLMLASSQSLPVQTCDRLAAITSGVASLTAGAARFLETGRIRQTVVDMEGGLLLLLAVGDRAHLAVLCAPGADLKQIGYETTLLVRRVAQVMDPGARPSGQPHPA
jgi:predicted regulator of Ras-like GTPase activity (Roadblock/LC7/MglB family)